jgi:hypothetical protein
VGDRTDGLGVAEARDERRYGIAKMVVPTEKPK